ncbi:MAG: hypothetical protein ABIR96_04910 [Bdellovibrionota bacterium]
MSNQSKFFVLTLVLAGLAPQVVSAAQSRAGMAHYVGSGLAYPTLNHALFVNPTALVDSPLTSLQASYMLDPGNVHSSITTGGGTAGFGIGYRQNGSSSTEEFGLAGRINIMTLGATLRTHEFQGLDGDLAATFDFGAMRLTAIGRGANQGFDRADVGLGFTSGPFSLGIDAKKPLAAGDESYDFDVGMSVSDGRISAGFGYTFAYNGASMVAGDIHSGLSFDVTKGAALEAFYKPSTQEWSPGDWVLGARFQL